MANTLNLGTGGNWAAKEGSLLAYNDENGNFKPLPFDFTRVSSATRVNSQGLIEVVGSDQPRVDYSSGEGALLLEPQRTNLITYSEDFSNAAWIKLNSSITSNVVISPDGTQNADKLIEDTSTNFHRIKIDYTSNSNVDYTYSKFVKKNGVDKFSIKESNSSGAGGIFNLTNKTATAIQGNATSIIPVVAKIEEFPNGWFKCSFTWKSSVSGLLSYATTLKDESYIGDGTSGVYIWGAQLEEASYPTSYIPTSGSAVTRNADVANGAGDASTFNSSEGVLMAEISALADDLTNRRISISNGTTSDDNRINLMYTAASNQITINYKASGTTRVSFSYVLKDVKDYNKVLMLYKSGDFRFYVNGFKLDTDSNTTMIADGTLSELAFEDAQNINNFYGNTKQVMTFKEALTDAELENLTSWDSFIELAQGQQYIIY
jgi:hypothetical protein